MSSVLAEPAARVGSNAPPEQAASERPWWSKPGAKLLAECKLGRAEIAAAEGFERPRL